MFAIFLWNLGFVIRSFAKIAENETSELSQAPLSELIFGSWDYRTNEEEMADVMMFDISGMWKFKISLIYPVRNLKIFDVKY